MPDVHNDELEEGTELARKTMQVALKPGLLYKFSKFARSIDHYYSETNRLLLATYVITTIATSVQNLQKKSKALKAVG
jgi:hypothetical protein